MATTTDVKLLADQIRIEGRRQVIVDALDLCVDSPDRRSEHNTPDRRALVHDGGDVLTINYGYDYPGGVRIYHLKEIHARPKMLTSPGAVHLTISGNTKIEGDLRIDGTVDGDLKVAGRVLFRPKAVPGTVIAHPPGQPLPPPTPPLDLADVILTLQ
jgi:hypothetical protein